MFDMRLAKNDLKNYSVAKMAEHLWRRVAPADKTVFIALLALGLFTYFIFFSQFLLDNHGFRMPWLYHNEQVQNGRWMGPLIGWLTYGANVPVMMQGLSLVLSVVAALTAVRVYAPKQNLTPALFMGAIIVVAPINLAYYYYSFMSPIFFAANLLAVVAAVALSRFSLLRIVAATTLIVLMLATYQAAVSVLTVLVLTGVVWRACNLPPEDDRVASAQRAQPTDSVPQKLGWGSALKGIWLPALGALVATIAGLVIYSFSIQYLPDNGKIVDLTDLQVILERGREVATAAFRHLIITQPDILGALNGALGLLLLGAAAASAWRARRSPVGLASLLLAWPLAILGTKAIFFISDPGGMYQYRYNGGLIYLYAFAGLALLAWHPRGLINIVSSILVIFIVIVSIQADLVRQHVLLRGQERDLSTFNRILYRIESLPEFDATQPYDLVRIGPLPRYRLRLLASGGHRWDELGDGHMDYGEISDLWVDDHVFGLLGATIRIAPGPKQTGDQIRAEGLLEGREPWPAADSVFIDEGRIIIFTQ